MYNFKNATTSVCDPTKQFKKTYNNLNGLVKYSKVISLLV